MPDDPIDPITDPPVDPVDPPNDLPVDPPTDPAPVVEHESDPLEEETFRTVKKFNRAVKANREPDNPPDPAPAPTPAPTPTPAPRDKLAGGGLLDPFRKKRK